MLLRQKWLNKVCRDRYISSACPRSAHKKVTQAQTLQSCRVTFSTCPKRPITCAAHDRYHCLTLSIIVVYDPPSTIALSYLLSTVYCLLLISHSLLSPLELLHVSL